MIPTNKYKIAVAELATFNLGDYEIPNEIQEAEKNFYVTVCVKSKDNIDGTAKVHQALTRYADRNKWNEMRRQSTGKNAIFKTAFGGVFNKVVIVHDPTLKTEPVNKEEPKKKGLSPTIKSKIKALHLEGKDAEVIATELEKDLELVSAYIADKL